MEIIPLPDYTMRAGGYQSSSNGSTGGGVGGALNLASSLPSLCCAPDMGPKMFIAYGENKNRTEKFKNKINNEVLGAIEDKSQKSY